MVERDAAFKRTASLYFCQQAFVDKRRDRLTDGTAAHVILNGKLLFRLNLFPIGHILDLAAQVLHNLMI